MGCCENHSNSHLHEEPNDWREGVAATALCLVGLIAGWLATRFGLPVLGWVFFVVSYGAGLWIAVPESVKSLAKLQLDVDSLMVFVALGAWWLNAPAEGALLLVLFGGGRAMEAYARQRTHSAISELSKDLPRHVTRIVGENHEEVDVDVINPGDLILIKPGDRFPLDCRVGAEPIEVDLSSITGESGLRQVERGGEVPSGAVNGLVAVKVSALRPAKESAYQKIMWLIENAPARKSPAQALSEKAGRYFTQAILLVSFAAFAWWFFISGLVLRDAAYRAITLLVAGSPCAVVLSIPSAVLAAIAAGARRGLLFNGGVGLSQLATIRRMAFDKTGTITSGDTSVSRVAGSGARSPEDLSLAFLLARSSTHPASRSIVRYFESQNIDILHEVITDIREVPGVGVTARWEGKLVELGRPRGDEPPIEGASPEASRTVLRVDGEVRLVYFLGEDPRPEAIEAIKGLKALGISTEILSGDVQPAVDRIARIVGIDRARGALKPEEKHAAILASANEAPTGMVGDGVNDAPALAAATVGIAMGMRGSAGTLAQADIILVKDRLTDLVAAIDLSRRTQAIIRQNLGIAIGLATILVIEALLGNLPLSLGVIGHEGGTVLVVLNSLRLLRSPRTEPAAPQNTIAPALATT